MATALVVAATNKFKDQVILQGLTVVASTRAGDDLGMVIEATSGEQYRYVATCTTITAAPIAGYPAFWSDGAPGGNTISTTQNDAFGSGFAGVMCAAIANAEPGLNYVWIQTKGVVPSASASTGTGAPLMAKTSQLQEVSGSSTSFIRSEVVELAATGLQVSGASLLADVQIGE